MARTKASSTLHPRPTGPIKDPWDREHEEFLRRNPHALVHSDAFYNGVVHKGFDADDTAEELVRRYPAFEESEEHRKFLVGSIRERLGVRRDDDVHFTPGQLWEEDDRINGRKTFTSSDEGSWADEESDEDDDLRSAKRQKFEHEEPVRPSFVPKGLVGEEELESDEQLAELCPEPAIPAPVGDINSSLSPGQDPQDAAITEDELAELFGEDKTQSEVDGTEPQHDQDQGHTKDNEHVTEAVDDSEEPVTVQFDGHAMAIMQDDTDMQLIFNDLDVSPNAKVTAISSISVDGSLVLAVLGHAEPSDLSSNLPTPESLPAQNDSPTTEQTTVKEWNILTERPHRFKVGFLSGPETLNAFVTECYWDPETIVATTSKFEDGRILIVLAGEQSELNLSSTVTANKHIDPTERFNDFFAAIKKHENITSEHSELASLLQVLHQDMISTSTLQDPTLAENKSESEDEFKIPTHNGHSVEDDVEALIAYGAKTRKRRYLVEEAKKLAVSPSISYSETRMRQLLRRPTVATRYSSHVRSSEESKVAQEIAEKLTRIGCRAKPENAGKRNRSLSPEDYEDDEDTDHEPTVRPQKKRKTADTVLNVTDEHESARSDDDKDKATDDGNEPQKGHKPIQPIAETKGDEKAMAKPGITGKRRRPSLDNDQDGESDGEEMPPRPQKKQKVTTIPTITGEQRPAPPDDTEDKYSEDGTQPTTKPQKKRKPTQPKGDGKTKSTPITTGKRQRALSDDEEQDDAATNNDGVTTRPQKKRKTVQPKGKNAIDGSESKGKGKRTAAAESKTQSSPQQKKKKHHAPTTAAQSQRAIAEVKAKLARFEALKHGTGVDDSVAEPVENEEYDRMMENIGVMDDEDEVSSEEE